MQGGSHVWPGELPLALLDATISFLRQQVQVGLAQHLLPSRARHVFAEAFVEWALGVLLGRCFLTKRGGEMFSRKRKSGNDTHRKRK